MARFEGQVAIVTGAGSGIGEAIAVRLATEGATVCVTDRNIDAARTVAAGVRAKAGAAEAHHLEVTDDASVQAAFSWAQEHLGPVDVLVNNAATATSTPLEEMSEKDWDRDVDVVLKGPFLCARAVLPDMVRRRRGVVVNVGSVNGFQFLGQDAYSAAKAGLVSLTRSIAVRYGPYGIRANLVAPGTVRTPAWTNRLAANPELLDQLTRWYPLGRLGEVDDVAAAVAFLISNEASWISGTVLCVDGGLLAGNAMMARETSGGLR